MFHKDDDENHNESLEELVTTSDVVDDIQPSDFLYNGSPTDFYRVLLDTPVVMT